MLHLLQPIWLAAMAAISVPVAVHLWNDRRGKVLRIGSVALLSGVTTRLAWSRRITQWLLLLLRCLLLLALAFLLAGPYWTRLAPEGKGWVLVEGSGGAYAPVIDSLVKAGYERHELGGGGNSWAGFREADSVALPGRDFYVFSTALMGRFSGPRPTTARPVHWEVYTPVDSVTRWVQSAWLSSVDSVTVLEGSSKATGTMWQRKSDRAPKTEGSRRSDGGLGVGAKVDTTSIRVRIIADGNHTTDGKYVAAAVKALRRVTGRHIIFGDGGWLFWLSDRPVVGEGYERIWCYAQGKEVAVDTWMEGVHVMKEIAAAPVGKPVWRDGYGRGLLSKAGNVFRFYSRLDANWGDLVWSSRLPVLLGGLMIRDEEAGMWDRRVMDVEEIRPAKRVGVNKEVGVERVDLRPAVWVLILGLFLLERIKANQYEQA
jgi:Aerotolerance regulator N-terminal